MKKFVEEHGFAVLAAIITIIFISISGPISKGVESNVKKLINKFSVNVNRQFDGIHSDPLIASLVSKDNETVLYLNKDLPSCSFVIHGSISGLETERELEPIIKEDGGYYFDYSDFDKDKPVYIEIINEETGEQTLSNNVIQPDTEVVVEVLEFNEEVPSDGVYSTIKGVEYKSGNKLPSPKWKDKFVYKDYIYEYKYNVNGKYGWTVRVNDKTQTHYGNILTSINNIPVLSISNAFKGCDNLVETPTIPDSIIDMRHAFYSCPNLKTVKPIPVSVKDLTRTFYKCSSLEGTIEINAEPDMYGEIFNYASKNFKLTGSSSKLAKFGG